MELYFAFDAREVWQTWLCIKKRGRIRKSAPVQNTPSKLIICEYFKVFLSHESSGPHGLQISFQFHHLLQLFVSFLLFHPVSLIALLHYSFPNQCQNIKN